MDYTCSNWPSSIVSKRDFKLKANMFFVKAPGAMVLGVAIPSLHLLFEVSTAETDSEAAEQLELVACIASSLTLGNTSPAVAAKDSASPSNQHFEPRS